jgi:hypothetical protein
MTAFLPPNPIGQAGSGTFFDETPKASGLIYIIRSICLFHYSNWGETPDF